MAEIGFGTLRDVGFDRFPILMLVPDFFADAANRQDPLQQVDFFGELPGLAAGADDQISNKHQHANADEAIDDGGCDRPGRFPKEGETQPNERLDDSECVSVGRSGKPSGQGDGNHECDRELHKWPAEKIKREKAGGDQEMNRCPRHQRYQWAGGFLFF